MNTEDNRQIVQVLEWKSLFYKYFLKEFETKCLSIIIYGHIPICRAVQSHLITSALVLDWMAMSHTNLTLMLRLGREDGGTDYALWKNVDEGEGNE